MDVIHSRSRFQFPVPIMMMHNFENGTKKPPCKLSYKWAVFYRQYGTKAWTGKATVLTWANGSWKNGTGVTRCWCTEFMAYFVFAVKLVEVNSAQSAPNVVSTRSRICAQLEQKQMKGRACWPVRGITCKCWLSHIPAISSYHTKITYASIKKHNARPLLQKTI